jgi:hypothetical protein
VPIPYAKLLIELLELLQSSRALFFLHESWRNFKSCSCLNDIGNILKEKKEWMVEVIYTE